MKYRGALIGCGFFAENHLNAWTALPDAELVAVCDLDRAKAEAAAATFGIPGVFTDAAQMLESQALDFVDIVTTVPSHRPLVELACRHSRAVICQKPFAETLEDGQAMVAAARLHDVALIVHENFCWQRGFIELKRLLDAGRIGRTHFARLSFRTHYDIYRKQPYLADVEQFLVMDVGLHLFDLARHFLGEVEQVTCLNQRLNPIVRGEDAFTSLLKHTSGATSVVDASYYTWHSPELFPQTLATLEGDLGTMELLEGYRLRIHTARGCEELDVEPDVPVWGEKPWHGVQESVVQLQRHVLDVLGGRTTPQPSGADNLKTLALALACYESAEVGKDKH